MLTRPGLVVGLAGIALIAAGRVLGVLELVVLGVIAVILLAVCLVTVLRSRPRLELVRDVRPPRVHAGTPSRVELAIRNRGAHRSPVVRLVDPVTGTGGAELQVAPLEPGESVTAAYRLPTERRGILTIGPLTMDVGDPFGLVRATRVSGSAAGLTVLPKVDVIAPLASTVGNDPLAGTDRPNALGRIGEDFYALRPYVVGDDLRRVHWLSSARAGDLLVRQDEQPWQGRVTVLLDVRRTTTDADTFERLVSAAASIVTACWDRNDLVRLVATDGTDTGFVAGNAQLDALMEYLAVVRTVAAGSLRRSLGALPTGGGALVAVMANVPQGELDTVCSLRGRFGSLTVVHLDPTDGPRTARVSSAAVVFAKVRVVRVGPDARFADEWNRVIRSGRQRLVRRPPGTAVARAAARST